MSTAVPVRISDKLICYYKTHLHYYSIEIRTGTAVMAYSGRRGLNKTQWIFFRHKFHEFLKHCLLCSIDGLKR